MADPAAANGDQDILVEKEKKPNRIMTALSYLPFGDTITSSTRSLVTFLDTRIPTIRGRPAMSELIANLKPGITVSLVSLPLSISLAIAADATPVQGIITAAWAGLMSAFFGGSHYNIVGPTGALSGILSEFSVRYGPGIQPLLAILAGIISGIVWATRLDRFFVFIPSAVMHGFTLGVAFIIALNQLNFIFGLPKLPRHEGFLDNLWESLTHLYLANWFAVIFFVASYGALFFLQRKYGKIPWSIVLATVGIIIGAVQEAMGWSVQLATIKSRYGELQMSLVQVPDLFTKGINASFSEWVHIIQGSLSIAMVAVLETLISASIADRMTKTLFAQTKEVLAIALCNAASGLAGGIPATAALARTALNIKSGATSRAAGIINGISIVILSTVLFGMFKYLPLPVVAAILVNVAVRMVEWPEVKLLYKMDKPMFIVAIVSGLVCIVEDPTMGIIAGALLGMIVMLLQMRNAHAILRLYKGSFCRMAYLFDGVDVPKSTGACKAKWVSTTGDDERIAAALIQGLSMKAQGKKGGTSATELALIADSVGVGASAAIISASAASAATDLTAGAGDASTGKKLSRRERRTARRAAALSSGRDIQSVEADLLHVEPDKRDATLPVVAVYKLPGYFTYVAAQAHRDRLRALFLSPGGPGCLDPTPAKTAASTDAATAAPAPTTTSPSPSIIVFGMEDTYFADPDALETVGTLVEELKRAGKEVYLLGFHAKVLKPISKAHFYHEVRTFGEYIDLLLYLRDQVDPITNKYTPPPPPEDPHKHAAVADAAAKPADAAAGNTQAGGASAGTPAPADGAKVVATRALAPPPGPSHPHAHAHPHSATATGVTPHPHAQFQGVHQRVAAAAHPQTPAGSTVPSAAAAQYHPMHTTAGPTGALAHPAASATRPVTAGVPGSALAHQQQHYAGSPAISQAAAATSMVTIQQHHVHPMQQQHRLPAGPQAGHFAQAGVPSTGAGPQQQGWSSF